MSLDQQFNKNSTKTSLDQKLQCLLCYKRFATKEESAVHMKTRHRITLAGAIDKSMRSVFNWPDHNEETKMFCPKCQMSMQ